MDTKRVKQVKFPARKKYESKYSDILESILTMKPGEPMLCVSDKEIKPSVLRNRISAAVRRVLKRQDGFPYRIRIRETANGDVVAYVEED